MRRILLCLLSGLFFTAGLAPVAAGAQEAADPAQPGVPADSGAGRRVVYSNSQQRVWLVEEDGAVARTHLVSGRRNFPRSGTFAVFSRSPTSRSGAVTMQYMVRFHQARRLAVGFHSIPVNRRGRPIQSEAQLGTPRSRGCVRQSLEDARFMWDWAHLGTTVVVVP